MRKPLQKSFWHTQKIITFNNMRRRNKWREIPFRAFLGFIPAVFISPIVAHIPPHIGWLAYVSGVLASLILGIILVRKEIIDDDFPYGRAGTYLLHLLYYVLGGALGGLAGIFFTYYVE